jgi:PGF-pre-PGF domain-containing protein
MILSEVSFDALQNLATMKLRVEVLHARSQFAESDPKGTVYRYINIWFDRSGLTEDQHFENAKISFKVENQWIEDNSIDVSSITLNRYHGDEWNRLDTQLVGSDDVSSYYVANTPGFSPFSITGDSLADKESQRVSQDIIDDVMSDDNKESESASIPGFELIFAIVGLLAVSQVARRY